MSLKAQSITSKNCAFSATNLKTNLRRVFGSEFVSAEQEGQSKMPLLHHPSHLASILFPHMKFTGTLPKQYLPESAPVFEIPAFFIPETDLKSKAISSHLKLEDDIYAFEKNGLRYFRYFVHPIERNTIKELQSTYEKDPTSWFAGPTSSTRSLMIIDANDFTNFLFAKTSIQQDIGLYHRTISKAKITRAIRVNDILSELKDSTNGYLKETNKIWGFFEENLGLIPKKSPSHGLIYRSLPPEIRNNKDFFIVPWMSLVASIDGERLIDTLYKNSSYDNKLEFAWQELAKPVLELHSILTLKAGLSTEMHQQNMLLAINRNSFQVEGIFLRDMDGMWIDYIVRKLLSKQEDLSIGNTFTFKYDLAQKNMHFSYESKIRLESFRWILKYLLPSKELKHLLKMSDQFILEKFNESFPTYGTESFVDLPKAWKRLHDQNTSPEEKAIFDEVKNTRSKISQKSNESFVHKLTELYLRLTR